MIFYIQNIDNKTQNLVGNKAFNLSILHKNNFKIPRGFILTTEIFDDFTTSKKISNFENIKEKFVEQFGQNSKVIVRSSANFEDREDASFAGIYESYLNVGLEELEEKIELVFNSIFSEKALAYYKNNNIPKEKVKMAVIIQEQIKPLISGVCFTKNPINRRDEYIIEYVTGSNDKFVSGFETPNNLIFNQDFSLQSKVEDSLYLEIIKGSLDKFKQIEELFRKPQDVEWAIDNNKEIFFLQARDIVFEKEVIDEINHQKPIAHGVAMSSGIGRGNLKFINSNLNFEDLKNSISNKDVIMAHNLRVDQILAIQNAAGIILTEASILSHVAIQAREFKIPCVGGIYEKNLFTEGQEITINGSTGAIYEGLKNDNFTENTLKNKFPNYINVDLIKEYQAEGIHFLYCIVDNEAMIYLPRVGDKKLEEQACEILNLEFKISPENIHINQIKVYEKENAASSIYSYFQDYKLMLLDPELGPILEECCKYLENLDLESLTKIVDKTRESAHQTFKSSYELFKDFKETKNTDTLETCAELMDKSLNSVALLNNVVILSFGNYYLEKHLKNLEGPSLNKLLESEKFEEPQIQRLKELSLLLENYKNTELEPLSIEGVTFIDMIDYIYENGFEKYVLKYNW